ncbi:hypothetical protein CANARDRAFT_201855 [[Candida] arabinofermentans NRRL YB-2248]|uniref:DUF7082 domain-containing protein n=1 Tax=[Candida] arabinofermentans NRRL YB-2248 TaxID=983967 RepID=A0A1E4SX45_9ASCO|nr:hypothetical protein CANARDRAFT_201855 [[Candida] arabinofermentans NRRL YB-2248]
MTPSEFHAEVHKLELSIQQPLQLQSQLQLQPQYKTVDLFPPATACTPQPNHRNVLPNNYISRRESLESEFDYKTIADDNEEDGDKFDFQDIHSGSAKRYSVMRGVSSGGSATKPPQGERNQGDFEFIKCKLTILDADESSICKPEWSNAEKEDKRRIIRIERRQREHEIITSFQIVGAAESNPEPKASQPGVDVIEVSCLECLYSDDFSEDDDSHIVSEKNDESFLKKQHYITSVEVVKIVELLIGTQNPNLKERRKERGRIRSNLVPFWSKKPISSKKTTSGSSPSFSPAVSDNAKTNADFRNELAQRIMGYEIRKPRGFDKEVRILEWEKLVPALQRALQSYYVKIPTCDLN